MTGDEPDLSGLYQSVLQAAKTAAEAEVQRRLSLADWYARWFDIHRRRLDVARKTFERMSRRIGRQKKALRRANVRDRARRRALQVALPVLRSAAVLRGAHGQFCTKTWDARATVCSCEIGNALQVVEAALQAVPDNAYSHEDGRP